MMMNGNKINIEVVNWLPESLSSIYVYMRWPGTATHKCCGFIFATGWMDLMGSPTIIIMENFYMVTWILLYHPKNNHPTIQQRQIMYRRHFISSSLINERKISIWGCCSALTMSFALYTQKNKSSIPKTMMMGAERCHSNDDD